jgi:hypothetical protein
MEDLKFSQGYNAMQPVESEMTFRRNILPTSSGSKNKPSMKLIWSSYQAKTSTVMLEETFVQNFR